MTNLYWGDSWDNVAVLGCGGTGGFVAEGLCRMLPKKYKITLIDHDRVEERNRLRQNFHSEDLGKFKSEALAERFCRIYSREILYSVWPLMAPDHFQLVIGCVDNARAREMLSRSHYSWWIDSGNSRHSGQVLIGNTQKWPPQNLKAFSQQKMYAKRTVNYLPAPTLQLPSLLAPSPAPSCAEDDDQSPVINQAMAALVLQFVHRLINRELDWMGVYLDLEAGTMSTVPATPETVARMLGVKINSLVAK
ncbi:MAG: ThiF family adenylyltransferase [Dehalococcoidia bacterium]|nr:ThiF family adenylyltransferase [Dehalococcoidia bacterium]